MLKEIQSQGAELPDTLVRDASHAVFVLYRWTADTSHKSRDVMTKVASGAWKVQRTVSIGTGKRKVHRPPLQIARDLEQLVSAEANKIFNAHPGEHTHWRLLQESYDWVQQKCITLPSLSSDDLTGVMTNIKSWLGMRRVTNRELHERRFKTHRVAQRRTSSLSSLTRPRRSR